MPPRPPLPTSIGRFRIDALIGAGGMGEVYKAVDPTLQRVVALKTVRSDIDNPEYLARLYREAQACARLRHPNVVSIYEAGEADALVYLVMEFLQGEDLRALLRRGALTLLERIDVLCQVLAALQHTHAEGVIHRDIKPSNVHRSPDGTIKLVDFGLAQVAMASPLTRTGIALCTPEYASPEQLRDEPLDGRTDIYSTGALAYELLSGRPAFAGGSGSVGALIYKAMTEAPPPMEVAWSQVVPELEQIVTKAMAKSPADRYQTAAEMRQALLDVVARSRDAILAEQARQEAEGRRIASEAQTLIDDGHPEDAETLLAETVRLNPDAREAKTLLNDTRRERVSRPVTAPTFVPSSEPPALAGAPPPPVASVAESASAPPPASRPRTAPVSVAPEPPLPAAPAADALPQTPASSTSWRWIAGGGVAAAIAVAVWFAWSSASTSGTASTGTAAQTITVRTGGATASAGAASTATTGTASGADASRGATPDRPDSTRLPAAGTTSANGVASTSAATTGATTSRTTATASAPPASAKQLYSAHPSDAGAANLGLRFRLTRLGADGVEGDVDGATTTFHSGDRIRFTFESNVDGYLYVVQQGSSGRWTVLFPGPNINGGKNAIGKGQRYQVPNDDWFLFDENPGTEQVFVFMSREPLKQLPGFDRPVTRYETVVASVVDDLKQRVQSRDLILEKDRTPATASGAVQATYVVNKAQVADAVAASIALVHAK